MSTTIANPSSLPQSAAQQQQQQQQQASQNQMLASNNPNDIAQAYVDTMVQHTPSANKRTADTAFGLGNGAPASPKKQKTGEVVSTRPIILESNDGTETVIAPQQTMQQPNAVQQKTQQPVAMSSIAQNPPRPIGMTNAHQVPNSLDFAKLVKREILEQVIEVAKAFSKTGRYINLKPLKEKYVELTGEQVNPGYILRFQTPPMVCTSGISSGKEYPNSYGALLSCSSVSDVLDNINQQLPPGETPLQDKVGDFNQFMHALVEYVNDHLVANIADIFLQESVKIKEAQKKNPKLANPFEEHMFVTKSANNDYGQSLRQQGKYSDEMYRQDVTNAIATFISSYDAGESFQLKFRNVKNKGNDTGVPDVEMTDGLTNIAKPFDFSAPYCQNGKTLFVAKYKLSLCWFEDKLRFNAYAEGIKYYPNGAAGGSSGNQNIQFR